MRLFATLTWDQLADLMGGQVIEGDTDALVAGLGDDIEFDRGGDMITIRLPNERPGMPEMNLIIRADNMDGHGALTLVLETLSDIEPEKPEEGPSEATLELIGRLRRALIGHLPAHHELLVDADALLKPKTSDAVKILRNRYPKPLCQKLNEAGIILSGVGGINLIRLQGELAEAVHFSDFGIREGRITPHPESLGWGRYVPTVYSGSGNAYYDEGAGEWRQA